MKYLKIETKTFKPIHMLSGDSIEFAYDGITLPIRSVSKTTSIESVLIIVTEDYGVVKGIAILEGDYE